MNPWYFAIYHLTRLVARVFFRFRVVHPERVIQEGPVILAMNHESYLDPPFAGIGCRRAIYFLARKSLLEVPVLGWLLPKLNVIPVDQEGGDRSALKALIRILRANQGALVFPEGSRTLDGNLTAAPRTALGLSSRKPSRRSCRCEFSARTRLCPGRWQAAPLSDHHRRRRAASFHRGRRRGQRPRGLPPPQPTRDGRDRRAAL